MRNIYKMTICVALSVLFTCVLSAGQTKTFLKNRHAKSVKTIALDGMWYWNFKQCKAYADKHGVPLIAVWSNGDACSHCTKFENACDTKVFKDWMKTSGCVFYFTYPGDKGEGLIDSDVFHWIRGDNTSYPFVRVYWYVGGKKKVDVRAVGDTVDGNTNGSTGGKAARDYFKNLLKGYKYTPPAPTPVVPKYTGGEFAVGETDGDHLEADIDVTTAVDVPLARTTSAAQAVASTNTLQVVYPNSSTDSTTVFWTPGDVETNITVAIPDTITSTNTPIKLILLDAAGVGVATNGIRLVQSPENSPSNPLWLREKTADELAWGEWTMDLDVAVSKVNAYNAGTGETTSGKGKGLLGSPASPKDRAYTLVLLAGSLWCPDCKKTDEFLIMQQKFKDWAQENKVACVALDLPTGDNTSMAPTLLTDTPYTADKTKSYYGVSGASYLSRKMIDKGEAEEILERNFDIAQELRLPNWSNPTRPPVPSFFILRNDGTVAGRIQYFGGVESPKSAANIDAHIERLNELLRQVDDPDEESNDDRYRTTEMIGIREVVGTNGLKTISFSDSSDVYRLDPAATNGKRMSFAVMGDVDATVQLQLIRAVTDSSSVVAASSSGRLSDGVELEATVPSTNCYISVSYMTSNSVPSDAYFKVESANSTVCPYVLSTDFVVEPTDCASDNTISINDGVNEVTVNLVFGQLYRITNLDTSDVGNMEMLEPEEPSRGSATDLYRAKEEGAARLKLTAPETQIQMWNPGMVGFVAKRASVSESVVSYTIQVVRSGGASGTANLTLSLDELATKYPDLVSTGGMQSEFLWEEGDVEIKETKVYLVENTYADGDQIVYFAADCDGDAEPGIVEFALTVRDNDKTMPGKIAIANTTPAMAKTMTMFARAGAEVEISLERVGGASGIQEVSLSTTAGALDTTELVWPNRYSAPQSVFLTLPNSVGKVKVSVVPSKGSSVDASRRILTINVMDDALPGFAKDYKLLSGTRYVPIEPAAVALDDKEATTVKKYSGSLPPGVSWSYDATGRTVNFSGVPTKAGFFTAVFRAYNGSTEGFTTAVSFLVLDPVVAGGGDDGSKPLNAAVAQTLTLSDVAVVETGTNLIAGTLTITLPRNGHASAKFKSVDKGSISFSSASWSSFDEVGRTYSYSADLKGKYDDATLVLTATVATNGVVTLAMDGYDFIVPDTKWSKKNTASDFRGYYTSTMPYVATLSGDAVAKGNGVLTLKMNTTTAVNVGKVTFAGIYPNGKTFSGSSTLAAKDWLDEVGCWSRAVLPVVSQADKETFAGALEITPGAWDLSATNDVENGMCVGRCSYKAIRRQVRNAKETPVALWRHVDASADTCGDIALEVWGTYYDSAESFESCCLQSTLGAVNLTFFVLDGVNDALVVSNEAVTSHFSLGDVDLSLFATNKAGIAVTYAKASKSAKKKTNQIKKVSTATALSSFTFTLSTGMVSGSFKLDGVTFSFNGVVMPGWGAQDCLACGYSTGLDGGLEAQFMPFISGTAWFNDTLEYYDDYGKLRTAKVRRSTPFSVGIEPGK